MVYSASLLCGETLSLFFQPNGFDGSIYIVTDCSNLSGSCVCGSDQNGVGGEEECSIEETLLSQTYYIIIDAHDPDSGGPFTLENPLSLIGSGRNEGLPERSVDVEAIAAVQHLLEWKGADSRDETAGDPENRLQRFARQLSTKHERDTQHDKPEKHHRRRDCGIPPHSPRLVRDQRVELREGDGSSVISHRHYLSFASGPRRSSPEQVF